MNPDQFSEFFAEPEEVKGPFDFPPQVQEDVDGLRYLGFLTSDVEFCGHEFTLRTLNGDEEIAAAIASKHAQGSAKQVESYMQAIVGLSLANVDGNGDFCPPAAPNLDEFARARYKYVGRWFSPTIDFLYMEYTRLMQRQVDAVRAFQDFSSRNLGQHSPWPGSSTEQGAGDGPTTSGPLG